ncbi:MAG: PepSY domain-containing protein [Gammaproteobacteria bacterium]
MRTTDKRIVLLALPLATVVAAAEFDRAAPNNTAQSLGADQAAEIARHQTGGRILDVRPAATSGKSAYEVRVLLNEGRVRRVVVDVNSGVVE